MAVSRAGYGDVCGGRPYRGSPAPASCRLVHGLGNCFKRLVGKQRASIFAYVQGTELVLMFPVALSHFFLKKVIIEIVEVEHRLCALSCGPELKERALHGTFIVVRLR